MLKVNIIMVHNSCIPKKVEKGIEIIIIILQKCKIYIEKQLIINIFEQTLLWFLFVWMPSQQCTSQKDEQAQSQVYWVWPSNSIMGSLWRSRNCHAQLLQLVCLDTVVSCQHWASLWRDCCRFIVARAACMMWCCVAITDQCGSCCLCCVAITDQQRRDPRFSLSQHWHCRTKILFNFLYCACDWNYLVLCLWLKLSSTARVTVSSAARLYCFLRE